MSRAFVFLNCDTGSTNDIVNAIRSISGVFSASKLVGLYDVVADLRADSESDMAKIVRAFGLIQSIRSSLTMIVSEERDVKGAAAKMNDPTGSAVALPKPIGVGK